MRNRLLKHGTLLPAGGLAVFLGGSGTGRAVVSSSLFTRTGELAAILATGSKAAVDATKNPKWIDLELFTPNPGPSILGESLVWQRSHEEAVSFNSP